MKFKKSIYSTLTIGAVIAPIATVVACGQKPDSENFDKYVVVAANKEWVTEYKKIADAFNEANPNNKWKVLIKEQLDGDIDWETKSALDSSIPDIWTVDNNKVSQLKENDYITPYSNVTNLTSFENKYFDTNGDGSANNTFSNAAIVSSVNANSKVFAVPFNKEAQLALEINSSSPTIANNLGPDIDSNQYLNIAAPQELFKIAGMGQTNPQDSLFKMIGKNSSNYINTIKSGSNQDASVVTSLDKIYDDFISPLHTIGKKLTGKNLTDYKGIYNSDFMEMISAQEDTFIDAYKAKADSATSTWKTELGSKNPRLLFGTWRTNDIIKKITNAGIDEQKIHIYAPNGYHQWAGGWAYVINKRDEGEKAAIATDFIGELLKPSYANKLASVTGKPSPLTNISWNTGDTTKDDIYQQTDYASKIAISRKAVDGAADGATFEFWGVPNQTTEVFVNNAYDNKTGWKGKLSTSLDAVLKKLNQ